MPLDIDCDTLPPFPKRIPEKLRTIRERLGLTPDEIAKHVGAKTGAEIVAYENDEDDLLVSVFVGLREAFRQSANESGGRQPRSELDQRV